MTSAPAPQTKPPVSTTHSAALLHGADSSKLAGSMLLEVSYKALKRMDLGPS